MQNQKIRMKKRKFRIGELSKKLKIKKFVIRFWEKEFELSSDRSTGGQRFYTKKDLETFSFIKNLLYKEKFTIPGAKKQLELFLKKTYKINPAIKEQKKEPEVIIQLKENELPKKIKEQLNVLKQKLKKFKQHLK